MPSLWSYSDPADKGFGLFKRRILSVFSDLGWETFLAEEPLLKADSKPKIREHLFEHKPDWLLLINQTASHFYHYIELPRNQHPLPQQKLVWFLDDPHFFVNRPFEPNEFAFSFDETYLDFLEEMTPGGYGFLPLAADVSQMGNYDERYACDVCFVGGLIDQTERRNQLNPEMRQYVDRLVDLKLQQRSKSFFELAHENPIQQGKQITINPQVGHYLYWEANNRYRLQVVQALSDYNLRIYGNEEWLRLLQGSKLIHRFLGPCDPVKELPNIFATVPINLNIHSVQCQGSLNQRDFNAPVSGGFLLSDWVPAAGKYFVPGEEAVFWSSIDELRSKIDYYLEHPSERLRIIENGRKRVLQEHTYPIRVEQLVRTLQSSGVMQDR